MGLPGNRYWGVIGGQLPAAIESLIIIDPSDIMLLWWKRFGHEIIVYTRIIEICKYNNNNNTHCLRGMFLGSFRFDPLRDDFGGNDNREHSAADNVLESLRAGGKYIFRTSGSGSTTRPSFAFKVPELYPEKRMNCNLVEYTNNDHRSNIMGSGEKGASTI